MPPYVLNFTARAMCASASQLSLNNQARRYSNDDQVSMSLGRELA